MLGYARTFKLTNAIILPLLVQPKKNINLGALSGRAQTSRKHHLLRNPFTKFVAKMFRNV